MRVHHGDFFGFLFVDPKVIEYDQNNILSRPNIPMYVVGKDTLPPAKSAKHAFFCAIGGRSAINRAKVYASNYLSTYQKSTVRLALVPTDIGGSNESNDIISVQDGPHTIPQYSKVLSSPRINRHVILDSQMVESVATEHDLIMGMSTLIMHGVDLYLATNKRYPKGSDLPQQIYTTTANLMANTLKYKSHMDGMNVAILQKLSMLSDKCATEVGRSVIHAMVYPLLTLGISYDSALYMVGSTVIRKFLEASDAPKAKTIVKSLDRIVRANQVPVSNGIELISANDIPHMSGEILSNINVFWNNSLLDWKEEDIIKILHNVVGDFNG